MSCRVGWLLGISATFSLVDHAFSRGSAGSTAANATTADALAHPSCMYVYVYHKGAAANTVRSALEAKASRQLFSPLPTPSDLLAARNLAPFATLPPGVMDAFGHVSVRDPAGPQRYLLSRARAPELVQTDDICSFDLDGTLRPVAVGLSSTSSDGRELKGPRLPRHDLR